MDKLNQNLATKTTRYLKNIHPASVVVFIGFMLLVGFFSTCVC